MPTNYYFSIIIPTYNRATVLNRCLESLVDQTFKNFEVLVCDDGSFDDTKQVVEKYQGDLNLRYFYNENWGGPAKPRNIGIMNASAEWLCFLDSDDWYTNNRLSYIANLDLSNIDLLYHDLCIIKNENKSGKIKSRQLSSTSPFYDLLYNLNAIPTSSTCIRKKLVEKAGGFSLNKEIIGLEDFDLWIRMAKNGVRTQYLPIELGFYSIGNDNITLKNERQISRFKALYEFYIKELAQTKQKRKVQGALNYQIGNTYIQGRKRKKAILYLLKSFYKGSIAIKLKSIYKFFFV